MKATTAATRLLAQGLRHACKKKKKPPRGATRHLSTLHTPAKYAFGTGALLVGTSLVSLLAVSSVQQQQQQEQDPSSSSSSSSSSVGGAVNNNNNKDTRDPSLPRYHLSEIRQHDATSPRPWVMHADKVYDITDWVAAHPGGAVILRAAGQSLEPYWALFGIHQQGHVRDILATYLVGLVHGDDLDPATGRPCRRRRRRRRRLHDHHLYHSQQEEEEEGDDDDGLVWDDPFAQDPVRDARLTQHTTRPCNAEPPTADVADAFVTPTELFYVRNHMWVPVMGTTDLGDKEDKAKAKEEGPPTHTHTHTHTHTLTIELPDGEERTYTLADLRHRFATHRVTAVLQCAGNRRSDMTRHAEPTNGLPWGVGAIGNAEWEGVRLRDVLVDAGLKVVDVTSHTLSKPSPPSSSSSSQQQGKEVEEASPSIDPNTHHVHFTGLEAYAASIPLPTALNPANDVLLAHTMNGHPLAPDHGFPLRVLVPGHVAARSVKWLARIVVADDEAPSPWQRRDYKSFGPNQRTVRDRDWAAAPSIQEMPITSAITKVLVGACVHESTAGWVRQKLLGAGAGAGTGGDADAVVVQQQQPVALQGYAVAGGGRDVARVDISLDGGQTWDQADLVDEGGGGNKAWAWKRWRYFGALSLPLPLPSSSTPIDVDADDTKKPPCVEVVVKATDTGYNSQPQTHASIYNTRGNLANAWHRVQLCPECIVSPSPGDAAGTPVWRTGQAFGCGFGTQDSSPNKQA